MKNSNEKSFKRKSPTLLLVRSVISSALSKPRAMLRGTWRDKAKLFGFALLFVYAFGVIIFMSGGMAYSLCLFGAKDAVIPVMALSTSMLMLITAVSRGGKATFAPRDYEFLMSLPVPTRSIAASALVSSYIYDLLFILIIFLPASVVYAFSASPSVWFYILIIPTMLLLPVIPAFIGGFVGILISYLASRVKNKNLFTVLLNLVLVGFVFAFSFLGGLVSSDTEAIASMADALSDKVRYIYFPAELCGRGLSGDILSWLGFVLISALAGAVLILFSAKNYRKIHDFITVQAKPDKKKKTKKRTVSVTDTPTPIGKLLFVREIKRYFSIPSYVINTVIGPVLIIVFTAVFAFVPIGEMIADGTAADMEMTDVSDLTAGFEMTEEELAESAADEIMTMLGALLPSFLVMPVVMTAASASSISLEGSGRYILKSAPIKKRDLYGAKVKLNLLLLLPPITLGTLFLAVRAPFAGFSVYTVTASFIMPTAFAFFVSVFGLWCNLKFQKYDWKTEIEVVKQSTAVMIVTFLGMALTMCVMIGSVFLITVYSELFIFAVEAALSLLLFAVSYLFWRLSLRCDIK